MSNGQHPAQSQQVERPAVFRASFSQTMGVWSWRASSSGGYGLSDVAMSTYAPINYEVSISSGSLGATGLSQGAFTAQYETPRANSFGSLHPGGELGDGRRLGAVPQDDDRPDDLPCAGDEDRRRGRLGRLELRLAPPDHVGSQRLEEVDQIIDVPVVQRGARGVVMADEEVLERVGACVVNEPFALADRAERRRVEPSVADPIGQPDVITTRRRIVRGSMAGDAFAGEDLAAARDRRVAGSAGSGGGQTYNYRSPDLLNRPSFASGPGLGSDQPSNQLIRPGFCRVEMLYRTKDGLMRLPGWIQKDREVIIIRLIPSTSWMQMPACHPLRA
jgi:hypothetical protein